MYYSNTTTADAVKEFLIANQGAIKEDVMHLLQRKNEWLQTISSAYKEDLEYQYDARIKQHVAFVCAHALALPAECVIIELEKIDMEMYLNV